MIWNIVAPTGHRITIDVPAVELVTLSYSGVGLHRHYVSPDDVKIAGVSPPGWQALEANVQQLDGRMTLMSAALDRITASVGNVGKAVGDLADRVTAVGEAIKAHPAATDDAQLTALADQLDNISQEMGAAASDLQQTVDTVTGATPTPTPTPTPAVDPATGQPAA